jgi:cyclase
MKCRVIPTLLLEDGGLYKTKKFVDPRYIGDPINAIRIFNDKEVDELMVLDISVSKHRKPIDFNMIEQIAGECFMPLCYGGGIRTVEDAQRLFALGVEKVCVQNAALDDMTLVSRIAERFGSQSVIFSCDVRKNLLGSRIMRATAIGKDHKGDWKDYIIRAANAGAGEILLTSVDHDGVMQGMDLSLVKVGSEAVSVPLVAAGGVGCLADIRAAAEAGASAVGVGSYFVFHGSRRGVLITYPSQDQLKQLFAEEGPR